MHSVPFLDLTYPNMQITAAYIQARKKEKESRLEDSSKENGRFGRLLLEGEHNPRPSKIVGGQNERAKRSHRAIRRERQTRA